MNIYLVGMMGSGKTVTGKALAASAGLQFVDLDRKIERDQNATVNVLFETVGEMKFREFESAALLEVSRKSGQVVSTGGGAVIRQENCRVMRESGQVVFLETSLSWLIKRLKGSTDRPLLKTQNWTDKLESLLKERISLYQQAASLKITTDGKTAAMVAAEISNALGIKA